MRKKNENSILVKSSIVATAIITSAILIPKLYATPSVPATMASLVGSASCVSEYSYIFSENELVESQLVLSDAVPLDYHLQEVLQGFCGDYGVPYEIALAVIRQESRFDSSAENGRCFGYMQVNSINLEWLNREIGTTNLKDPVQNLQAGTYILGQLFEKYGEANMALTAYNHGEAGAERKFFSKGVISCPYSEKVIENSFEWKELLKR